MGDKSHVFYNNSMILSVLLIKAKMTAGRQENGENKSGRKAE